MPDEILHQIAGPASGTGTFWRWVKHIDGLHVHYVVAFDDEQFDEDGDGPFAHAEIPEEFLELISEGAQDEAET